MLHQRQEKEKVVSVMFVKLTRQTVTCLAQGHQSQESQILAVAQIPESSEALANPRALNEKNTMSATFLLNPGANTAWPAEALLVAIAACLGLLSDTSPL